MHDHRGLHQARPDGVASRDKPLDAVPKNESVVGTIVLEVVRMASIPLMPVFTSGTGVLIPLFPMCVHRLKHAVQQNAPRFTLSV